MGPEIRIGLAITLLASSASAGLELTPRVEEYELDGVKLRQLIFADGERRVTYAPPRKWQYWAAGIASCSDPLPNPAPKRRLP